MSFGERLRELREDKNLRQVDLGEILGVTGRQISYYENDKQFLPDEKMLHKIIDYFGVSADYLFGLTKSINYDNNEKILKIYNSLPKDVKAITDDYFEFLAMKYNKE